MTIQLNIQEIINVLLVIKLLSSLLFQLMFGLIKMIFSDTSIRILTALSSMATLVALGTGIYEYKKRNKNNKIALINALFDMIKHNLNRSRIILFKDEYVNINEYLKLGNILNNLGKNDEYPDFEKLDNIDHSSFESEKKISMLINHDSIFLPLLSNSVNQIFQSGLGHQVLSPRIAINLGHLVYSLEIFNITIGRYNDLVEQIALLEDELLQDNKPVYRTINLHNMFQCSSRLKNPIEIPKNESNTKKEFSNQSDEDNKKIEINMEYERSKAAQLIMFLWDEYFKKVHFREYFLILDLVMTYPECYFSDKKEYNRLKTMLPKI